MILSKLKNDRGTYCTDTLFRMNHILLHIDRYHRHAMVLAMCKNSSISLHPFEAAFDEERPARKKNRRVGSELRPQCTFISHFHTVYYILYFVYIVYWLYFHSIYKCVHMFCIILIYIVNLWYDNMICTDMLYMYYHRDMGYIGMFDADVSWHSGQYSSRKRVLSCWKIKKTLSNSSLA